MNNKAIFPQAMLKENKLGNFLKEEFVI